METNARVLPKDATHRGQAGPGLDRQKAARAHLGCSLYTEPSTPTVMRSRPSLRLSRIRLMTPASPVGAHVRGARGHALAGAGARCQPARGRGSQP